MISWNKVFKSKYLKASHLIDPITTVQVKDVKEELVGQPPELKAVVYFIGIEEGLILNKTNATALRTPFGDNEQRWVGKTVQLHKRQEMFRGEVHVVIRIVIPEASKAGDAKRARMNSEPDDDLPGFDDVPAPGDSDAPQDGEAAVV